MTKMRFHHPKASMERMELPRSEGGRGILDLQHLLDKQKSSLHEYFHTKVDSDIHTAIRHSDLNYTPLNLSSDNLQSNAISRAEKIEKWAHKELHGKHRHFLEDPKVDKFASNMWLMCGQIYPETEGYMIAIQDNVIPTKNYRKHILKEDITDTCRKCGKQGETIDHVISGCPDMVNTEYLQRHNMAAKIVYLKIIKQFKINKPIEPYYKYSPPNVIDDDNYKLLWDRSILTDKPIRANRPDIVFTINDLKTTYLIDIAVTHSHNMHNTYREKINKYTELAAEIKNIWKQDNVKILPFIISNTGVVPKSLISSIKELNLPKGTYIEIQKAIIIYTCHLTRAFFQNT